MKRLTVFNTVLLASAFLALMTLTACDAQKSLNPDEQTIDLESSEFSIYEYEDEMAGIQDATMQNDMSVSDADPQDHESTVRNRMRDRFRNRMKRQGMHLRNVLRDLDLTEDQKSQIREFVAQFRECIKDPIMSFREAARPIIEDAKAKRKEIIDAYKNEEISREEAKEQIKELAMAKREEMEALAEEMGLKEAICSCKQTLLDNIESILTEEQQTGFNSWRESLDGPCFSDQNGEG